MDISDPQTMGILIVGGCVGFLIVIFGLIGTLSDTDVVIGKNRIDTLYRYLAFINNINSIRHTDNSATYNLICQYSMNGEELIKSTIMSNDVHEINLIIEHLNNALKNISTINCKHPNGEVVTAINKYCAQRFKCGITEYHDKLDLTNISLDSEERLKLCKDIGA